MQHIIKLLVSFRVFDGWLLVSLVVFPNRTSLDAHEWQQCLSLPSVPYVLRMLAGLCKQHPGTQVVAIAAVEKVHLLEQVSTEKHLGTLAENVLETMMENAQCQREVGGVWSTLL